MNNKIKGIILMLTSAAAFSAMQIAIALVADTVPLFTQLFFRNLIATGVSYVILKKHKFKPFGHKGNRKLLFARAFFGYIGMLTLFYATANASQGDVAILNKMSPFVVTVLAVIFLKEKVTKYQVIALLTAFTGAFFVSNPKFTSDFFPLFIAFLSAVTSGVAYTFLSMLKGKEPPYVVIFFFSMLSTVFSLPIALIDFAMPSMVDMLYLLLIGIFASIGQITLTFSYNFAKASEISIYNYSGIVYSLIFGYIFLEQGLKANSLMGGVLVIIAGLIVFFGNRKITD